MSRQYVLAAAAALFTACSQREQLSNVQRMNLEAQAFRASTTPRRHPPSAAFVGSLRPLAAATVQLADNQGISFTRCTAAGEDLYFSSRQSPDLYVWKPRTGRFSRFEPDSAPRQPAALAWSPEDRTLHVLDAGRNRILKYAPDGRLLDYVPLNAGQSGFALLLRGNGGYMVGGERWESKDRVTLLASYDDAGRLVASSFPMNSTEVGEPLHVYSPVLLARDGDGLVVAEPVSYVLTRVDGQGRVLGTFGDAPAGYHGPPSLPSTLPAYADLQRWLASWTPLLFLHAGDGLVFAGFEVSRPYHGYRLEVYSAATGERVATGLTSDLRPVCGDGRKIVFVREGRAGEQNLAVYAFGAASEGPATGAGGHL